MCTSTRPAAAVPLGSKRCRRGEEFDRSKHEQGTEIKAITYSAMQIYDRQSEEKQCDVYVIVDI